MKSTIDFFAEFMEKVKLTPNWATMVNTVENSPWHREANVAVHTQMCISVYMERFFAHRNERQRALTMMALLFHDFGKPEAEETLEKKDEPGVMYRRYAGHEPISANEFMSFMCDQHELRQSFFNQGFNWDDLRRIKVMIEHHLPYGLKNEQKRANLKQMVETTFGEDEVCFYDMLRSDAAGRISDNHAEKLLNVELWIENFQLVVYKVRKEPKMDAPFLYLVVGVSGAGKSTWISKVMEIDSLTGDNSCVVFSEDVLRWEYARQFLYRDEFVDWGTMTTAEQYDAAWKFCHLNKESKFDQFSKARYFEALETGKNVIVDRMNQGRKARGGYIQAAKDKGYHVHSIEFFISEQVSKDRQQTRGDKKLPDHRAHQVYMQLETPWHGPEVDSFSIVDPT